jgi:hypothetical protein
MQQQTCYKKGKESPTYLDPQLMMRTQILLDRDFIVTYIVRAMRHFNDKEMLVILFNTGNYWLLLNISTMYDQVWYCDSARPTDPDTGKRLTYDYTDVMSILDE